MQREPDDWDKKREVIVPSLLEWFGRKGRTYPWRGTVEPYRVLVAEIMLQRTRADQVLPVFISFLEKFPDPASLAGAGPGEIEEIFARLGLRWRAERVRRLARALASDCGGRVPDDREKLLSLPGIGEYVADAVLCFAYGRDVAVVDANVCRVIGRLFGLKAKGEARRDARFKHVAQRLVPDGRAREFNWAMIDLASMICTPRRPRCGECPLGVVCPECRTQKKKERHL